MEQIRLIRPNITFKEIEQDFREIFEDGIFTKGKFLCRLECNLKKEIKSKYVHLVSSATVGLWLTLKFLNIGKGDSVIVSDYSYPATVNVIEDLGAIPIFAEVNQATYNLDVSKLKEEDLKKARALIFVDTFGNPSGLDEVGKICEEYGVPLIEDAACALGSTLNSVPCGGGSTYSCFSFHPRKIITGGEGGTIATKSEQFSAWLQTKLAQGARAVNNKIVFEDYGYKFSLTELQAAMVDKQLKKISETIRARQAIKTKYIEELHSLGMIPQEITKNSEHNVQSVVFTLPKHINRDSLIGELRSKGIETTIGTYCLSMCKYYKEKYRVDNKVSRWLEEKSITLPCYEGIDIDKVISKIKSSGLWSEQ